MLVGDSGHIPDLHTTLSAGGASHHRVRLRSLRWAGHSSRQWAGHSSRQWAGYGTHSLVLLLGHPGKLRRVEPIVGTLSFDEFAVIPLFHDRALLHHEDGVRIANSGETMRNNE